MAAGVIPPPYFITADDKRGLIVVTVALVLAFVWTSSLLRVWLRFQARDWRGDDWWLAFATLLQTIQSGIVLHLVQLGLGASLDGIPMSQLERLGQEGIASQIFYICTLLFSKCSILFLYLRLSPGGAHKFTSLAVVAASFTWALLSIILIVVPCNPAEYYTNPQGCTNRWPKWQAISSLDIVTEVLIFGIAIQLVWALQMSARAKIIVVFAFSARLPVIAFAATRLYHLHEHFLGTSTTFIYMVATQWQMGYAIMSSTITGMGPFLRPFNKEYITSHHSRSGYGHSSAFRPDQSRNTESTTKQQRNSCQSERYLMHSIPSRRGSRTTLSDTLEQSTLHTNSAVNMPDASAPSTSEYEKQPASQAPNRLTADANFRPVDKISRNETEIWVGNRTASFGAEDAGPRGLRDDRGLIIEKRTQVVIEVDRASCALE